MPRRLIPLALALLILGAAGGCARSTSGTGTSTPPEGRTFQTKTIDAGQVEVRIAPLRIDAESATFDITFDTHSVELSMDVAGEARLEVDGIAWTGARWRGDGPGGHHREGTLSFRPSGPPRGIARLSLGGLATPAEASWQIGGTP